MSHRQSLPHLSSSKRWYKKGGRVSFFFKSVRELFLYVFLYFRFFLLLLLLLFQFRIWNQLALRVILLPIFITHCFCCSSSIGCTSVMLTRLSYTLIYIHLSVLAVGVKRDQLREGERNITCRILLDMKTSPDPGAHIPMIQMQSDRSGWFTFPVSHTHAFQPINI